MLKKSRWPVAHPNGSIVKRAARDPYERGLVPLISSLGERGPKHMSPCEDLRHDRPHILATMSTSSLEGIRPDGYQWTPPDNRYGLTQQTRKRRSLATSMPLKLEEATTVRHIVVLGGDSIQGLHPYPYPYPHPLPPARSPIPR